MLASRTKFWPTQKKMRRYTSSNERWIYLTVLVGLELFLFLSCSKFSFGLHEISKILFHFLSGLGSFLFNFGISAFRSVNYILLSCDELLVTSFLNICNFFLNFWLLSLISSIFSYIVVSFSFTISRLSITSLWFFFCLIVNFSINSYCLI
jgi:hypothetical protein